MLTDRFGSRIEPGALVTYPGRGSSRLWMTDATVESVMITGKTRRWDRAGQMWVEEPTAKIVVSAPNWEGRETKRTVECLDLLTVVREAASDAL